MSNALDEVKDWNTIGVQWRVEREGVLGRKDLLPVCRPVQGVEWQQKRPFDSLLVRMVQMGELLPVRWLGAVTETMMNMDLGARVTSGSLFVPVERWEFDDHFERLEDKPMNGFVTIAIASGIPCMAWHGVPLLGLYTLLESFPNQALEYVLLAKAEPSQLITAGTLLSRFPFPCEMTNGAIAFIPPKEHFWPFIRVAGGICRTESTLLGVATASGGGDKEELQVRLVHTALGVDVDCLQFRSDVVKFLSKRIARTIKLRQVEPLVWLG